MQKNIRIAQTTEIDPSQEWFWRSRWAALEKQASQDFLTEHTTQAGSANEAITSLKRKHRPSRE